MTCLHFLHVKEFATEPRIIYFWVSHTQSLRPEDVSAFYCSSSFHWFSECLIYSLDEETTCRWENIFSFLRFHCLSILLLSFASMISFRFLIIFPKNNSFCSRCASKISSSIAHNNQCIWTIRIVVFREIFFMTLSAPLWNHPICVDYRFTYFVNFLNWEI